MTDKDSIDALLKATHETHPDKVDHTAVLTDATNNVRSIYELDPVVTRDPRDLGNFFDMFKRDRAPRNPNHIYTRRRIALGSVAVLSGIMLANGITNIVHANSSPDNTQESIVADTYNGVLNDRVASINLEDGARIREMPAVGDHGDLGTNMLQEVHLPDGSSISINTPEGVYIQNDEANGSWYGIRVQDLPPEIAEHAKADKDGVVWVNTQKADPTYTAPES